MNCCMILGCQRMICHKSHQIWLSAPPMPRSALSSTLVVGVISFPMDCTKILGFLWPENQRRLSLAQPTVTVPVVIPCSKTSAVPINPTWVPTSSGCLRVGGTGFQPQRKSSVPLHSAPGNLLSFLAPPPLPSFHSFFPLPSAGCLLRSPPTPGKGDPPKRV